MTGDATATVILLHNSVSVFTTYIIFSLSIFTDCSWYSLF